MSDRVLLTSTKGRDNIDRKMHQLGRVLFYRYMDDIRLFTKTKHDLKVALMELVKELRELKLNLNANLISIPCYSLISKMFSKFA